MAVCVCVCVCREYTELENKIARSLRETRLNTVPGFLDVAVQKFTRYEQFKEYRYLPNSFIYW